MDDNQRDSFRLERNFEAELSHEGRVSACVVTNLSAGGARIQTTFEMRTGRSCTLGILLDPRTRAEAGVDQVSFHMEILERTELPEAMIEYRLRNATGPGSSEYETAARLVVQAQRQMIAAETGAGEASPMVSDDDRRRRFRIPVRPRFGKGNMRPGSDD